jgi:lipoprotein-anchoring transpeptidase ErfK/SrfK
MIVAAMVMTVVGFDAGIALGEPQIHIDTTEGRFVGLELGAEGPAVERLQQALAEARLYPHEIDGTYGEATAAAVVAFHKLLGVERSDAWQPHDWLLLQDLPMPEIPKRGNEPTRIEVDIGNQLIYLIEDRNLTAIIPTSTAGAYSYYSVRQGATVRAGTPRGDFELFRFDPGWRCDPVTGWCVYNYWAFTTYYGLHGYLSVPAYPASHGCVRLHTFNSDWLSERFYIGMPVHVWDEPPPPVSVAEGAMARPD